MKCLNSEGAAFETKITGDRNKMSVSLCQRFDLLPFVFSNPSIKKNSLRNI